MHSFEFASLVLVITPKRLGLFIIIAIMISAMFRFIFDSKRELWFKHTPSSIYHIRGAIGQYLSLGYPVTLQGYLVVISILVCIFIAGVILFALPISMI